MTRVHIIIGLDGQIIQKTHKLVKDWMKCSNKRVIGYFWVRKSLFVDINVYHLHMYMVRGGFLLLFFRIIEKNYKKQMMRKWILERNWCEKKDLQVLELKTKRKGLATNI
jgi:hypothetical protein